MRDAAACVRAAAPLLLLLLPVAGCAGVEEEGGRDGIAQDLPAEQGEESADLPRDHLSGEQELDGIDDEPPGDGADDPDGTDSYDDVSEDPAQEPRCGDGIVQDPEECDDGNAEDGDGCDADCTFSCRRDADCDDDDPCTDERCEAGGGGRLCTRSFNTAPCDDADPCTFDDACDGAGLCTGDPVPCDDPPPDECADASTLRVYESPGSCDGSSGTAECVYPSSLEACGLGCEDGACVDDPQLDLSIEIYVDNFCNMTVVPSDVSVPSGRTAVLTYHNNSVDYPVDVWLSYGGGFLDLPTGGTWADSFEWCTGSSVYTGYADISTACSSHRLLIHCL